MADLSELAVITNIRLWHVCRRFTITDLDPPRMARFPLSEGVGEEFRKIQNFREDRLRNPGAAEGHVQGRGEKLDHIKGWEDRMGDMDARTA